jgi:hypothetical protein
VTGSGTCGDKGSVSLDGECGSRNGKTCKASAFGDCCSPAGFCGSSTTHCGAGCQSTSGDCSVPANVTADGCCGSNGKVCTDALDCCSAGGFCGSSSDHCGAGCQSTFGTCSTPTNITTDGRCGAGLNQKICKGSAFGECCSLGVTAGVRNIAKQNARFRLASATAGEAPSPPTDSVVSRMERRARALALGIAAPLAGTAAPRQRTAKPGASQRLAPARPGPARSRSTNNAAATARRARALPLETTAPP